MKTYKFPQFNVEIKGSTVTPNKDSILLNVTNSTISVSVLLETDSAKYGVLLEDIPVNNRTWYSYTKLLSDAYVQARSQNYLLIRTSFKSNPFPYKEAIVTQVGNFDYVDIIAALIIKLINKGAKGVFNVGTKKKRIYDLAVQSNPEVIPAFWKVHPLMPTNITMNVSKMEKFLNES